MKTVQWLKTLLAEGKPMPILSFPSIELLDVNVYDLTHNAELQTKGIIKVAERTNSAAAVTMMDLSVEAEAFGCTIIESEWEVPTVTGALITDQDAADELKVPNLNTARIPLYINAAKDAKQGISDRPVLAGIIGPYSLAGRLMDVSEIMVNCLVEPDLVHTVLRKTTEFLILYAKAFRDAGLDGIVMAEPLSGLLSPDLEAEFSAPYVKQIIDAVQNDDFCVVYHNCGPNVPLMTESLYNNGADIYHFGDAVSIKEMLEKMPSDKLVCGNISPSKSFLSGNAEQMYKVTTDLLKECSVHKNFVLSSGCDIPPKSPWENIDAFFAAAKDFYLKG